IYRPISAEEADAVLAKACDQMQPSSAEDAAEASAPADAATEGSSPVSDAEVAEPYQQHESTRLSEANIADDGGTATDTDGGEEEPQERSHTIGFRGVCAAVLVLTAVFCLWRSRDVIEYLSSTPEGRFRVLRESVTAFLYGNQGASPVGAAASDAQQDTFFCRGPSSTEKTPTLRIAATESTLPEARMPLPKAPDFPLPVPEFE